MIKKTIEDTACTGEIALVWALSAKYALANNYGYSPNQLVFGKNPNYPCAMNDKLPALQGVTWSELIAQHLNAMHSARKALFSVNLMKN